MVKAMRNARRISISISTLIFFVLGCRGDSTAVGGDETTGMSTAEGEPSTTTDAETTDADGTGSSTTSADESTTEEELCGNGELDPGEECDDGNDEWLDACRPDCKHSFEVLWTHSYDGPGNLFDVFADVVVDASGTIYVTGHHVVDSPRRELLVKAYTPDGREGWSFSWRGEGDEHDAGRSLAWLPGGDLVVCGTVTTLERGDDLGLMRLTPGAEAPIWVRTYNGPNVENGDDACAGVAVDAEGDIVAIGNERTTAAQGWDIVVLKYDQDGELLWSQSYGDPFDRGDFARDIAVDGELNVMALGRVREAQGLTRTWLRSYDPTGMERWTYRSGADGSENWHANGIAVNAADEILLTGTVSSTLVTRRFDSNAEEVWSYEASNGMYGNGVAVDVGGRVAVAGEVHTMTAGFDVWAGGFDEEGNPRWGFTYGNEVLELDDWANSAVIDDEGDVIVVGVETVLGQQRNGWIRKIRPVW